MTDNILTGHTKTGSQHPLNNNNGAMTHGRVENNRAAGLTALECPFKFLPHPNKYVRAEGLNCFCIECILNLPSSRASVLFSAGGNSTNRILPKQRVANKKLESEGAIGKNLQDEEDEKDEAREADEKDEVGKKDEASEADEEDEVGEKDEADDEDEKDERGEVVEMNPKKRKTTTTTAQKTTSRKRKAEKSSSFARKCKRNPGRSLGLNYSTQDFQVSSFMLGRRSF